MNTPGRDSKGPAPSRPRHPNAMSTIQGGHRLHRPGPLLPPGRAGWIMSYSNEGYAILSYVVDQAAGIPLEQFCRSGSSAPWAWSAR